MAGKYRSLSDYLRVAAHRGHRHTDLSFDEVAALIGGLPPSAFRSCQWWANGGSTQATAWRDAGFHVEQVNFERQRVRFEIGVRGGAGQARRRAVSMATDRHSATSSGRQPTLEPVGEPVDVRVRVRWSDAGTVLVDDGGRKTFCDLDPVPGLYRMTFDGGGLSRPKIYVGESDNLHRRMWTNYRHPGPSQQTSLRINAEIRGRLSAGGTVALEIATRAELIVAGAATEADLRRKWTRLLVENAALVALDRGGDEEVLNLG